MRVGALNTRLLAHKLRGGGLGLEIGPFHVRLRSPFQVVAEGLQRLYAHHRIVPASIPDFDIEVRPPSGPRRWFGAQACFLLDGQQPFRPLPRAHAFALMEWGLNWCVASYAHQFLILHAAVAVRGSRALVLAAPPGSGKSTLCAALAGRGWRVFSDELALVNIESGCVEPIARPISLKNASIDIIRRLMPGAVLSVPVPDTHKGTIAHLAPPRVSVERGDAAHIAWCVFPRYRAGQHARLAPLGKGNAFMRAAQQAFNYSVLGARGFEALRTVIADAGCYEFEFDDLNEALDALEALPEQTRD